MLFRTSYKFFITRKVIILLNVIFSKLKGSKEKIIKIESKSQNNYLIFFQIKYITRGQVILHSRNKLLTIIESQNKSKEKKNKKTLNYTHDLDK